MPHTVLTYGFVGIWSTELTEVPVLEQAQCVSVLGEDVRVVITSDGLSLTGANKVANALVNTKRMQLVLDTPKALATGLANLMGLLGVPEESPGKIFSLVGLNIEHEFTGLGKSGEHWMAEIVRGGLGLADQGNILHGYHLDFGIQLSSSGRNYFVTIEPREGVEHAIYCRVNDTRQWDASWKLTPAAVLEMLRASLEESRRDLFPLLKVSV